MFASLQANSSSQIKGCDIHGGAEVAALADRERLEETAMLRGVSAPVRFVRVAVGDVADKALGPRFGLSISWAGSSVWVGFRAGSASSA